MPRRSYVPDSAKAALLALTLGVWTAATAVAQNVELPQLRDKAAAAAYERGGVHMKKGHFDAAARAFDLAAKKAPTFYLAHYSAGNAWAQAGKLDAAAKRYEQTVAIAPKFASGWNALGVVRLRLRDLGNALVAFDKALAAEPTMGLALVHRGKTLLRLERPQDAEKNFRTALTHDADNHDARVALASARAAQNDFPGAFAILAETLVYDPKNGGAHLLRGQLQFLRHEFAKAAEDVSKALRVGGKLPHIRTEADGLCVNIAAAAKTAKEPLPRIRALELLVALRKKDFQVRNALGTALLRVYLSAQEGERDDSLRVRAVTALKASLKISPEQPNVKRLLERYAAAPER